MGRHKITCRSRDVQALNARAMVLVGLERVGVSWGGCFCEEVLCFFLLGWN